MSTHSPRELLKAADIAKMEPTRAVHSLNPNAVRFKRQLSDLTGLTQFGVHLLTLMPGHESAEYHRHLYEEEFVYVLSGTGAVTIGECTEAIGPGDFLGFPRGGEAHTVQNTGDAPLELPNENPPPPAQLILLMSAAMDCGGEIHDIAMVVNLQGTGLIARWKCAPCGL